MFPYFRALGGVLGVTKLGYGIRTRRCGSPCFMAGQGKGSLVCLRQNVTKWVTVCDLWGTYLRQAEGRYWLGTVVCELQFHAMLPLVVTGDNTS